MTDYQRLGVEYQGSSPHVGSHPDPLLPLRDLPANASYDAIREALKAFKALLNGASGSDRVLIRNEALHEVSRARPGEAWADAVDAAMAEKREARTVPIGLTFNEADPWDGSEPVDGADLLEAICVFIRRFLDLPDGADFLLATFVLYSYARDAFPVSPYLVVHSPAPQCGKTRVLELLELLVLRPWRTIVPTTAVLFRVIQDRRPCLLLDEAEVVNTKTPQGSDVCAILQAGYKIGATVPRCVGDDFQVEMFSPFGPKVFALVGHELPAALFDRCIPIAMERRPRAEPGAEPKRFRQDRLEAEALVFRRKAARWAQDHLGALKAIDVPSLATISERQEEVWEPLLAVGMQAGGSWYPLLRAAAERLSGDRTTTTPGVDLLLDVRAVFVAKSVDRLRSADLASALNELEGHRWGDWNRGKGITPNEVARKLRDFSVTPGTVRFGPDPKDTAKGYRREQFAEAWERYAPGVTAAQVPGQVVTGSGRCDDVTAVTPPSGMEG